MGCLRTQEIMILSPTDRAEVLDKIADKAWAEIRESMDVEDLICLPIDTVAIMTGLGATQVRRVMETRPMGKRKRGVSLKTLKAYQAKP